MYVNCTFLTVRRAPCAVWKLLLSWCISLIHVSSQSLAVGVIYNSTLFAITVNSVDELLFDLRSNLFWLSWYSFVFNMSMFVCFSYMLNHCCVIMQFYYFLFSWLHGDIFLIKIRFNIFYVQTWISAERVGYGEGASPPREGAVPPPQKMFRFFQLKKASFGASLVLFFAVD